MEFLLLINIVGSSFEYHENALEVNYINSSFNNDPSMIKLFEYVKDNVFEHGNSSSGYISVSILPFPMDIIDAKKWNKLYNYCDEDYVALVKFCIQKGNTPYLYGHEKSTYTHGQFFRQPKIEDGLLHYGQDGLSMKMKADRIIFEKEKSSATPYGAIYYDYDYIDRLNKWGKIAISRSYNEQEYIDYFISNDFPLNRLRNLLKLLAKDSLELVRRQIDEKENTERLLKYNRLLQKYCVKLIQHCEEYLEKQAKSQKVPITF
ncbi:hypothetical protein TVAG_242840 [Trichomonas vaginalis G3]|uniref:Uncharacterized protein n=1 Tax=Trichomonas vaginalis (strain ATCC PRA-98 / G3) TaxID=412133 RepID=A2F843_TRIV3|nr:hypothetical protein TVAGG3_0283120 [Trichomonas vaginalis G3]EAX98919.1 hypothetical protein TVAG_242840 [Trichomonas vaginalis G3]KAI5526704.1 hypothetical protein TVAGG3_0283120 [Trichomonas vaginalis G3]|eukprot:XP_001311849.1 hypothetical protein [Trichomonas vaginalis G3]